MLSTSAARYPIAKNSALLYVYVYALRCPAVDAEDENENK